MNTARILNGLLHEKMIAPEYSSNTARKIKLNRKYDFFV